MRQTLRLAEVEAQPPVPLGRTGRPRVHVQPRRGAHAVVKLFKSRDVRPRVLNTVFDPVLGWKRITPPFGEVFGVQARMGLPEDIEDSFGPGPHRAAHPAFKVSLGNRWCCVPGEPHGKEDSGQRRRRHPRLVVDVEGAERLAQLIFDPDAH